MCGQKSLIMIIWSAAGALSQLHDPQCTVQSEAGAGLSSQPVWSASLLACSAHNQRDSQALLWRHCASHQHCASSAVITVMIALKQCHLTTTLQSFLAHLSSAQIRESIAGIYQASPLCSPQSIIDKSFKFSAEQCLMLMKEFDIFIIFIESIFWKFTRTKTDQMLELSSCFVTIFSARID